MKVASLGKKAKPLPSNIIKAKTLKAQVKKRMPLALSTPLGKVIQKTVDKESSTPALDKNLKGSILEMSQKLDRSHDKLRRQSLLSCRRNSFNVKPLESATPKAEFKVSNSLKKSSVVTTPDNKDATETQELKVGAQSGPTKKLKRKAPPASTPAAEVNKSNIVEHSPAKIKKFAGKEREDSKKLVRAQEVKKIKRERSGKKIKKHVTQPMMVKVAPAGIVPKTKPQVNVSVDPRLQNVQEAAEAALEVIGEKQAGLSKKHLFAGDAQPIYLQLHTVKIPRMAPRALRFNLPHSVHDAKPDIVLILGDPIKGRKRDTEQEVIVEDYKELLEKKGVKNIKEVIPFNYLRTQYNQYEMKRRFANSFDVFLCDTRFLGHAQHFLGKNFFTRRCLTPVRLYNEQTADWVDDFKKAIDFSLHKAWMRVHGRGTTYNMIIGNTRHSKEEIAANILSAFDQLQSVFPGGLDNIKIGLLKGHQTLPLPLFASTKPHDEVPVPYVKPPHPKLGEPATDELSTKPGRVVTVYPGGRIDLRNKMTAEDEEYEESMGHESRWKIEQKRLQRQQNGNAVKEERNGGSEEELEEEQNDGTEDKPGKKTNSGKVVLREKRSLRGKKLPAKKTFSPGKKFSSGNKPPGKKFGKKFSPGNKPSHGKNFAEGKKVSAGSKPSPGKKGNPAKVAAQGKTKQGKTPRKS